MNQEAIELLEKASGDICEAQMNREKFDSLSLARQKIAHVLTLLKQQPAAGDFTKKYREVLSLNRQVINHEVGLGGFELCARLDRAASTNKDLLEACETAFNESHNPKVERILDAAIAKAKKEGVTK